MVILLLGIGLFAIVAYRDVRTRRIANELSIAVAVLGLARIALAGDLHAALYTLAAAAAVFAVAFAMFWRGWIGGGDAKLLSASALLVGSHDLPAFLLLMGLCGAVLAIAVLAAARFDGRLRYLLPPVMQAPLETLRGQARPSVPYGVAIAAAGVLVLVLQSSIPK
jgi:prepilin peptidase CpaA